MTETRETMVKLRLELQEVRATAGAQRSGTPSAVADEIPTKETTTSNAALSRRARGRAARAAVDDGVPDQLSVDLARLGIDEAGRTALAEAVQTTRAIIAEYA
jgi:type IV secretion system protein VirD4